MQLRSALVVSVLAAAACGPRSSRPAPSHDATCYRFDRAYFGWARDDSTGQMVSETSAVVELSAQPHPPFPLVPNDGSAKVVRVPLLRGSAATAEMWMDPSYWTAVGDSVVIVWRDGYVGPIFRVQTRGDSLVGTMRWTTDENWRHPVAVEARAKRIVCPAARATT